MIEIALPYEVEAGEDSHGGDPFACTLYKMLPKAMKLTTKQDVHLLEYLHKVPVNEVGIPEYYVELTRKLKDKKKLNLIYPVGNSIYIHVMDDPEGGRGYYIAVEPTLREHLNERELVHDVEMQLLNYAEDFESADSPEDLQEVFKAVLDKIMNIQAGDDDSDEEVSGPLGYVRNLIFKSLAAKKKKGMDLSADDAKVLKYIMVRDKLGMGVLEPLILDTNIEDISCSGVGPIFVEHKIFDSLRTSFGFDNEVELDKFVLRLSERIKKPVTVRVPVVDASLPDGSRINIVYGSDVSRNGSNFTIRKFSETPLSILELVKFGSLDFMMAAFLSLAMEEGLNIFVAGETASGKTTLLNAITVFIDANAKIVSIEDTAEVQVPHPNWIREVTRQSKPGEEGSGVGMFDLLKAALRQRPDEIIIGEIRGEEGLIAFQAMQTGHSVMATFHASSVAKLIQRLTGSPISVPKTYIDNLNLVVIQEGVKLPDGKPGRRATSISEIISYDSVSDAFSFAELFKWDPVTDKFDFVGENNSFLLEYKIAPQRGIPPNKKRQIYALIRKRARILEKLAEKGVTEYQEFYKVIAKAQKDGIF
ncbi:MAG: type II/IV secretion system ATPase subunit [Chloroflexi bacterium]|nr:type II/IV secretion system ATPase subunit [Chloroflexota bacterium]